MPEGLEAVDFEAVVSAGLPVLLFDVDVCVTHGVVRVPWISPSEHHLGHRSWRNATDARHSCLLDVSLTLKGSSSQVVVAHKSPLGNVAWLIRRFDLLIDNVLALSGGREHEIAEVIKSRGRFSTVAAQWITLLDVSPVSLAGVSVLVLDQEISLV